MNDTASGVPPRPGSVCCIAVLVSALYFYAMHIALTAHFEGNEPVQCEGVSKWLLFLAYVILVSQGVTLICTFLEYFLADRSTSKALVTGVHKIVTFVALTFYLYWTFMGWRSVQYPVFEMGQQCGQAGTWAYVLLMINTVALALAACGICCALMALGGVAAVAYG